MRYCEVCKQPIDADRARDLPKTRLCAEHGAAIKKFGGEFIGLPEDEVTSKRDSMKKNYGAVGVSFVRNQKAVDQLRNEYLLSQE